MNLSYEQILTRASKEADTFSLTWRPEFRFSKKAAQIEKKLKPYQRNEQITSSWPGTDLTGGTALVRTYSLNEATVAVLSQVPGIFSWLAPHYPEDLAFYKNGAVVFWSVAHEEEAGFAAQPSLQADRSLSRPSKRQSALG